MKNIVITTHTSVQQGNVVVQLLLPSTVYVRTYICTCVRARLSLGVGKLGHGRTAHGSVTDIPRSSTAAGTDFFFPFLNAHTHTHVGRYHTSVGRFRKTPRLRRLTRLKTQTKHVPSITLRRQSVSRRVDTRHEHASKKHTCFFSSTHGEDENNDARLVDGNGSRAVPAEKTYHVCTRGDRVAVKTIRSPAEVRRSIRRSFEKSRESCARGVFFVKRRRIRPIEFDAKHTVRRFRRSRKSFFVRRHETSGGVTIDRRDGQKATGL